MITQNAVQESRYEVTVPHEPDLRKKAALAIAKTAQRFQSDTSLRAGPFQVNAKSIMLTLEMLRVLEGQSLVVTARGQDAEEVVQALSKVIQPALS